METYEKQSVIPRIVSVAGQIEMSTADGSIVWQKNVIKSFYVDPQVSALTDQPIIDTVTFV